VRLPARARHRSFIDFSRSSGMSMAKQVKFFVQALNRAASNRGSAKFTTEELEHYVRDMRLQVVSVMEFLEVRGTSCALRVRSLRAPPHSLFCAASRPRQVLNQQSYLLKTGPREWKLMTSTASTARS